MIFSTSHLKCLIQKAGMCNSSSWNFLPLRVSHYKYKNSQPGPFMRQTLLVLTTLFCLSTKGQNRKIDVSVNTNIEVINALTIPLYPEMLKDSLKKTWMYENTQLMRLANDYFKPFR